MVRTASLGLGSVLIAFGVLWFYSSLLDDVLVRIAGPLVGTTVTDMSKMSLSDELSLMFSGIAVTGIGLVLFGLYALDPCDCTVTEDTQRET